MTAGVGARAVGNGAATGVRLAALAFALAMLAIGAVLLVDSLRAIPLNNLSGRLEAGEQFSVVPDPRRFRSPKLFDLGRVCDVGVHRALISVRLGVIDSVVNTADFMSFRTAMDEAREELVRLLRCHPGDGGAWLRLASIELQRAGPVPETLEALRISRELSRSEIWNLRGRLPLMMRVAAAGVPGFGEAIEQDLALLFEQGLGRDIVAVYGGTPAAARGPLNARIQAFSFERYSNMLAALRAAGIPVDPAALPPAHRIPWVQRRQG
jgi:hypothetical protein